MKKIPVCYGLDVSTTCTAGCVVNAETGELVLIDTGSAAFRKQYETLGSAEKGRLRELFRSMDVDHIEIFTDRDYVFDLVKFFKTRERRAQK